MTNADRFEVDKYVRSTDAKTRDSWQVSVGKHYVCYPRFLFVPPWTMKLIRVCLSTSRAWVWGCSRSPARMSMLAQPYFSHVHGKKIVGSLVRFLGYRAPISRCERARSLTLIFYAHQCEQSTYEREHVYLRDLAGQVLIVFK